jgi:hypothetical protein
VLSSPDLCRHDVVESFRDRIQRADRLRLSQEDLSRLINGFLVLLQGATSEVEIKSICGAEIQLLEEGYPRPTVAKYLTVYRKAIVKAIADGLLPLSDCNSHHFVHHQRVTGLQEERLEHWALTYLKYAPEVYEQITQRSQVTNREKQLSLRLVPVHRYLDLLQQFLQRPGVFADRWLAVAIAGLTGRRFAEVIAKGTFSLTGHSHMLHFEGQQKSARSEGYDILTLIPAQGVLAAIERLRQFPEVKAMAQLRGEGLKQSLNLLNRKLNAMCGAALCEVVPPLDGKKTVTVHNLRGLYGAIAVYFFCPPQHHEYAFIQHYLGHVLSSAATGHYFRYALVDSDGKLLRDKGVLRAEIEQWPLPIADCSEETMVRIQNNKTPKNKTPKNTQHPVAIVDQSTPAQAELNRVQTELHPEMAQLRSEFESRLRDLEQRFQTSWIIQRLETLEVENLTLKQQYDAAITLAQQYQTGVSNLQCLMTENEILRKQLCQAQAKLDGFRQLLNGTEIEDPVVVPPDGTQQSRKQMPISPLDLLPTQGESNSAIAPATTTPDLSRPPATVRGPKSGKAFQRAEAIFAAIQDWNRLHPSESFAVNPGLLETIFRIHRQAAKEFFEAYQNELWDYHQELGVESPRWHNRGKDPQQLKAFVLQKLGG